MTKGNNRTKLVIYKKTWAVLAMRVIKQVEQFGTASLAALLLGICSAPALGAEAERLQAAKNAYFGDLHVHTAYSTDAFAFGATATPDDAYRYAKGGAIEHALGYTITIDRPLDFYAVTDHAEFLGTFKAAASGTAPFSQQSDAIDDALGFNAAQRRTLASLDRRMAMKSFDGLTAALAAGEIDAGTIDAVMMDAWQDTQAAADRHYQPGQFTTFLGFEYSARAPTRGSLHRNVIFRGSGEAPALPFSMQRDPNPEALWDWMDALRREGIDTLAIPHNSNLSSGQMFKSVDWTGNAIDTDYAIQRARNEPLVEVTQGKGTSETHPTLSPEDEWAGFEVLQYPTPVPGSFARTALLRGLSFSASGVANPYALGLIGASDTHNGAASVEERSYISSFSLMDGLPLLRGSVPLSDGEKQSQAIEQNKRALRVQTLAGRRYVTGFYDYMGASGLAGVWAEENTREAIFAALRRKETFATSGPRIKARFFAGHQLNPEMLADQKLTALVSDQGIAMGGELNTRQDRVPTFIAWAIMDPQSAPLQRLQVIKGWISAGSQHEQVYDVACAGGARVDPKTHRCADAGATVDLRDCSLHLSDLNPGAAELKTAWQDPDFQADQFAFYYLRVLEQPSCRWSTWDALNAGEAPRPGLEATIQERAWTSPIWMRPQDP